MRTVILATLVCLGLGFQSAHAQQRCAVTDPTGTPLNVRSAPNGPIVGAFHNGAVVRRMETRSDDRGRLWSLIVPEGPGMAGWVFREFVSCF